MFKKWLFANLFMTARRFVLLDYAIASSILPNSQLYEYYVKLQTKLIIKNK